MELPPRTRRILSGRRKAVAWYSLVIPYEKIDDKAATDVIIARLDNAEPVAWNLPDVIQPFASM